MRLAHGLIAGVSALAACTPLVPFHVAETAEVLRGGQVSVTAAGGVAGTIDTRGRGDCCDGGTGARLRVGVGAQQELGVSGAVYIRDTGSSRGVQAWAGAAKAEWKAGITEWLAVVAGFGFSYWQDVAASGDLGFILSSKLTRRMPVAFYAAARGVVAFPLVDDWRRHGGATESLVLPGGVAIGASIFRVYLEAGYIATWQQQWDTRVLPVHVRYDNFFHAIYGAVAFAVTLGP